MKELFDQFGWKVSLEQAPLPDGRTKEAVIVERCDSVHIIAELLPGIILLLREFRPFYGTYIWMLPSGRADKETDMAVAAQRELQEETGFQAKTLQHLWTTRHSESFRSANHIFHALHLSPAPLPQDADEMIEVHEMPLQQAIDAILQSPVVHTPSAYALLRFDREKK